MMKKLLISLLAVLLTAIVSYGQYAPVQDQSSDYTMTDEYRHAKALYTGGIIAASVGAVVNIAGNVICVIEQNRYTNSNATSGSLEEIYQLNQEAKEQPGYRCGQVMEIAGFAGVLVGGGIALYGAGKMKKIKNAQGNTVAIIGYGATSYGVGFSLAF